MTVGGRLHRGLCSHLPTFSRRPASNTISYFLFPLSGYTVAHTVPGTLLVLEYNVTLTDQDLFPNSPDAWLNNDN